MPHEATVYMGPGRHLVVYPLRGGKLINIVAVEERDSWAAEGWHHTDDPENFRASFAGFLPEITKLLSLVEEVLLWGLFYHPVAESWSQSSTVIVGDAVHPMLPFLAQGANMAIEDAWVLAEEMDRHEDLSDAFAAYYKRRKKRVSRVVKASKGNTRLYHLSSPPMRALAHVAMRLAGRYAPERLRGRFDWLYGEDVTKSGS